MSIYFRPTGKYLVVLAIVVSMIPVAILVRGDSTDVFSAVTGWLLIAATAALALMIGMPALASTLLRVPVVAVTDAALRLPFMGLTLDWAEVRGTARATKPGPIGRPGLPVLLIEVVDPDAVIARARPWLRKEMRRTVELLGSPIAFSPASLDRSQDDVEDAISARASTTGPSSA